MNGDRHSRLAHRWSRPALILLLAFTINTALCANDHGDTEMKGKKKGAGTSVIRPVKDRPLELSGCAVVKGGMLVVGDELIGSVLYLKDVDASPAVFATINLERKRTDRKPYTSLDKLFPLQDFEDIATDREERVYLLGSHEGKRYKGETQFERRPDREFLLEAKWDRKDEELKVGAENYGVLDQIVPVLNTLGCGITFSETLSDPAINIEGLAFRDGTLYLGLRAPQTPAGDAIVLIADADAAMGTGNFGGWKPISLDLRGGGVRGLDWDPKKSQLLIVSGPGVDKKNGTAALWRCDAGGESLQVVLEFDEDVAKKGPEGVCRTEDGDLIVVLDGEGGKAGGEIVVIHD